VVDGSQAKSEQIQSGTGEEEVREPIPEVLPLPQGRAQQDAAQLVPGQEEERHLREVPQEGAQDEHLLRIPPAHEQSVQQALSARTSSFPIFTFSKYLFR
jgi:hypothetical protein